MKMSKNLTPPPSLSLSPYPPHRSIFAHADSIMSVSFVAHTHYVFTVSKDKTIKYWDGDTFEHIQTLEAHQAEVCVCVCVAFSLTLSTNVPCI